MNRLNKAPQQIEEVRSRLFFEQSKYAQYDAKTRIKSLKDAIKKSSEGELLRHAVVGSIAALETFHRGTLVSIIDSSDEYRSRAAEMITVKLSMKDALSLFGSKKVTYGELIAHAAPCSSVGDLVTWLGNLLSCNMKQALAQACDPYERRSGKMNLVPIIHDVDQLLVELAEGFRLRHIYAHEAVPLLVVQSESCGRLLEAVEKWMEAVISILWTTAFAELPLTQVEMNQQAFADVRIARKDLATSLRDL